MKRKNIALLISAISLLIVGCNKPNPYIVVDSDGYSHDLTPPSPDDLHLRNTSKGENVVTVKRAKNWPVRAIYLRWKGIYEFDRQGNVLRKNNRPVSGYLVEYYLNGSPAWTGGQEVYYWRNDKDFENKIFYDVDVTIEALVKVNDNLVCPVRQTAMGYVENEVRYDENAKWIYFLSPHCDKASKVKINNREFWVYPEDKENINDEFFTSFWSVQYFSDPITPMYDEDGKCMLYCDTEVKE